MPLRTMIRSPIVRVAVLIACSAVATASSTYAQCPPTDWAGYTLDPGSTTAPTFADSAADNWVWGDHTIGRYALHHPGSLAPTIITARDRFDVTGVPPGTEVPVTLKFEVAGWAYTASCGGTGCCGTCTAIVRAWPDTAVVYMSGHTFGGRADFSGVVTVPVVLTAGVPRDIEVELYARRCPGGSHTVDATGQVVFEGTDPNAQVVSCKGFGPVAVPVQRRTWGSLKTMYR